MALKRPAIVVSTAALVVSVMAFPAEAQTGYLCLTAEATQTGDTYTLFHEGCSGSGIYDVPVVVWSGPAAGTYVCRHVSFSPMDAEFYATGCVRT